MKKISVLVTIKKEDLVKDKLILIRNYNNSIILTRIIEYKEKTEELTLYSTQLGDGCSLTHTFNLKTSKNGNMFFKRRETHVFHIVMVKYTLISVVSGHLE